MGQRQLLRGYPCSGGQPTAMHMLASLNELCESLKEHKKLGGLNAGVYREAMGVGLIPMHYMYV